MSLKSVAAVAVAALLIGFAAYALSAQPPERGAWGYGEGGRDQTLRFERIVQFLDLDADQAEQWLRWVDEQQARSAFRRDQIDGLRQEFRIEADRDTPDLEELGRIALEIYNELQSSRTERDQIKSDLESLLTPDQLDRFEALDAARGLSGRHQKGWGRRSALGTADG